MSQQESKQADPQVAEEALKDVVKSEKSNVPVEDVSSGEDVPADSTADTVAANATAKKKKSKRKKIKAALAGKEDGASSSGRLSGEQLQQLLKENPSLKAEMEGLDPNKAAEMMRKLNVSDILTGMSVTGKNQKDMASYKFWQTQPVPSFEDKGKVMEGPIKIIDLERVPKEPSPLVEGFEWVTMDLTDDKELVEVYDLLSHHYVEDDEAMFRFNYSHAFLNWYG